MTRDLIDSLPSVGLVVSRITLVAYARKFRHHVEVFFVFRCNLLCLCGQRSRVGELTMFSPFTAHKS